jgi:hypothetical protein
VVDAGEFGEGVSAAYRIKEMIARGVIKPSEVTWIEFGAPGMSDTIFQLKRSYGGRFGAIEVKKPSGVVKPEQHGFLRNVMDAGGIAGVARSIDQAQAIIESGVVAMAVA